MLSILFWSTFPNKGSNVCALTWNVKHRRGMNSKYIFLMVLWWFLPTSCDQRTRLGVVVLVKVKRVVVYPENESETGLNRPAVERDRSCKRALTFLLYDEEFWLADWIKRMLNEVSAHTSRRIHPYSNSMWPKTRAVRETFVWPTNALTCREMKWCISHFGVADTIVFSVLHWKTWRVLNSVVVSGKAHLVILGKSLLMLWNKTY